MTQGPLDHPSYLTRQMVFLGKTTAGANTVQYVTGATAGMCFPYDVRVRNVAAVVGVAGTSASPGSSVVFYAPGTSVQYPASSLINGAGTFAANGSAATTTTTNTTTTTLGFLPLGTATAGVVVYSGDMNFRIPAGQTVIIKNGTDATAVASSIAIEVYIDPVAASWTGPN